MKLLPGILVASLGRAEANTYSLVFHLTVFTVLTWCRPPKKWEVLHLTRVCPVPNLWPYPFSEEIIYKNKAEAPVRRSAW